MNKEEVRNFVKARILEAGYTMSELVDVLSTDYGWSDSLSNFSAKLGRGSLRYAEAVKIADILGYDIIWKKRR